MKNLKRFSYVIKSNASRYSAHSWREDLVPPRDYDFLVEFQKGVDLFDHVGLKLDLEKYLKKKVDVVTKKSVSKYLRGRVLKEAEYLDV